MEYNQSESYKITGQHDKLTNKISLIKYDSSLLKDKEKQNNIDGMYFNITIVINTLVTIDDQFNYVSFSYNLKQKFQTEQKHLNMSKALIDATKTQRLILTKLIYDKIKKM